MSRFLTILLVALTFSLVVWSHPVQADQSLVAREARAADQVVAIFSNLKRELKPEIESLRDHHNAHADTSADVKRIEASVQKARADMVALDKTQFQSLTSAESIRIKQATKELVQEVVKAGSGSGVAPRGIGREPRQGADGGLGELEDLLSGLPIIGPILARLLSPLLSLLGGPTGGGLQ